jgi:thiol-disulfide isomerase/thioredoxin
MPSRQRRLFLRAIGTAMSVGIGGCAGRSAGGAADDAAPTTATDDPLTLPSAVTTGDLPDGRVRLKESGTVTLLNFFTTWCRPCQREMSEFRELRAEYDADTLHMVSITPEVEETLVEEFWAEYEGTWPVVMDPALTATERWNANRYPTNLLFDADGKPAGDAPKVRARTFEEFDALIEPLVAEA